MRSMRSKLALTTMLLAGSWTSALGLSPEARCEAVKNKLAGKYAFCRQSAEARAIRKGQPADYSKCDDKLLSKWGKAEQQALQRGAACVDSVTDAMVRSFITAHADAVAAALGGGPFAVRGFPASGQTSAYGAGSDGAEQAGRALSYTDNGDGTITDHNTGLVWEKKDDSGGIHDKDNTYFWCADMCESTDMNGSLKATFLDTLNDVAGGGVDCFAGHCDWRIPNVRELQSIIDYEVVTPAVNPVFHRGPTCTGCTDVNVESCSCTMALAYWTSTTYSELTFFAWYVVFDAGNVANINKNLAHRARAVRGGD